MCVFVFHVVAVCAPTPPLEFPPPPLAGGSCVGMRLLHGVGLCVLKGLWGKGRRCVRSLPVFGAFISIGSQQRLRVANDLVIGQLLFFIR